MSFGLPNMRFNDPDAPLLAPDPTGRLRRVHLETASVIDLRAASPAPSIRPAGLCWTASASALDVVVPLEHPVRRHPWVIDLRGPHLGLRGLAAAGIGIRAETAGTEPRRVDFVEHPHPGDRLLLTPTPFAAAQLELRLPPGEGLCLVAASAAEVVPDA
jgi:hypothetical protein